MTERFKNAYDKLVKAYYNGALMAGDCDACAIGNLVGGSGWQAALFLHRCAPTDIRHADFDGQFMPNQLYEKTGYYVYELSEIELAFEQNTYIKNHHRYRPMIIWFTEKQILADQFNGLEAVINVMLALDGVTEPQPTIMNPFKEKLVDANQL